MFSGSAIVVVLLVAVLVWLLFYEIPISARLKNIFAVILAIGILLLILNLLGVVAF